MIQVFYRSGLGHDSIQINHQDFSMDRLFHLLHEEIKNEDSFRLVASEIIHNLIELIFIRYSSRCKLTFTSPLLSTALSQYLIEEFYILADLEKEKMSFRHGYLLLTMLPDPPKDNPRIEKLFRSISSYIAQQSDNRHGHYRAEWSSLLENYFVWWEDNILHAFTPTPEDNSIDKLLPSTWNCRLRFVVKDLFDKLPVTMRNRITQHTLTGYGAQLFQLKSLSPWSFLLDFDDPSLEEDLILLFALSFILLSSLESTGQTQADCQRDRAIALMKVASILINQELKNDKITEDQKQINITKVNVLSLSPCVIL